MLCIKFNVTDGQNILLGMKGTNAHDQGGFCAFHTFLVEVQTNAGYIHATHVQQQPGD